MCAARVACESVCALRSAVWLWACRVKAEAGDKNEAESQGPWLGRARREDPARAPARARPRSTASIQGAGGGERATPDTHRTRKHIRGMRGAGGALSV